MSEPKAPRHAEYPDGTPSGNLVTPFLEMTSSERSVFFGSRMSVSSPQIFVDLDDTLSDFSAHFGRVFGYLKPPADDVAAWRSAHNHPTLWLDAPLAPGAREFMQSIAHLSPIVLSSCFGNFAGCARQKREWVRHNLPVGVWFIPTPDSLTKPLYMQDAGDILIDDQINSVEAWQRCGGVAILHRNWDATAAGLADAMRAWPVNCNTGSGYQA